MKRWAITAVVYAEGETAAVAMHYAQQQADQINQLVEDTELPEFSVVIHSDDVPEEEPRDD